MVNESVGEIKYTERTKELQNSEITSEIKYTDNVRELRYTVTTEDGQSTARRIMVERFQLSSREITRCKQFKDGVMAIMGEEREAVHIMGEEQEAVPIMVKQLLDPGDILIVRVYEDVDNASEIVPWDIPIDIVYEDEDLILVNKPGDMVVHPSYAHYTDSLSNALAGYYKKTGQNHVIRTIGRLDRETSGLIIFAKNRHSAALLSDQKDKMSRRKEYLALCHGIFDEKEGTVNAPIGQNEGERMIRRVMDSGKEAITHYRVLKEFNDYSLVRLKLDTGRTHQIRVHMNYLGHPLLGDNLYGKDIPDNHGMTRAALHAASLSFFQPVTGEELCFEADVPQDMEKLISN